MISPSMQMRADSPMCVCVLMLIGHGREQRPDAVGEIAHFEYWNQTVITAWRRCHHFTSRRGKEGGTRGMTQEKEREILAFLDNNMRECFDYMVARVCKSLRGAEINRKMPGKFHPATTQTSATKKQGSVCVCVTHQRQNNNLNTAVIYTS